jgi:predicted PurR-regulated permease PerM
LTSQLFDSMSRVVKYILLTALIVTIGFILWYLRSIVLYILISAFFTLLGQPIVKFLCGIKIKNFRIGRSLGAGLTLLFFWIVIFLAFSIYIPQIANQANEISKIDYYRIFERLNEPIQNLENFLQRLNPSGTEEFSIKKYAIETFVGVLDLSIITRFFQSFATMLGDIFVATFSISFITYFFLRDKGMLKSLIELVIPNKFIDSVIHVITSINTLLVRYFIGIILEVILVMLLITIGLSIIGFKLNNAMVVALFVGVLNVIPYLGPIIGAILGLLIGISTKLAENINLDFYSDLLPVAGLMLLVFISVQIIDNAVFQPLIYSSSVKAHPLEIFIIILVGGNIAGILGMVLAVPTYTIIKVILKEFFNNYELVKKFTSRL